MHVPTSYMLECMECMIFYLSNNHFIIITGRFTLKEVRRVTWDVRSKWKHLGGELEIDSGTLDVSVQINSSSTFYSAHIKIFISLRSCISIKFCINFCTVFLE